MLIKGLLERFVISNDLLFRMVCNFERLSNFDLFNLHRSVILLEDNTECEYSTICLFIIFLYRSV